MKLKKPNMKLKKPEMNVKRPQMKLPGPVNELVADLRRRKLLPVVAGLLVAIVALPVVLLKGSEEPAAPAAQSEVAAQTLVGAPEAQTLVVGKNESLRDYRVRLGKLAAKDPFMQQYAAPEGPAAGEGAAATDTGSASAAAETGSISATVTGTGSGKASGSKGKNKGKKKPSNGAAVTDTNEPQTITYEIDAWTGESGDLKLREDVQKFTPLPFDAKPAAVFLGVTNDSKKALFQISSSVLTLSGDGICLLGIGRCDMIALAPGKSATMLFGPNGITYGIKVVRINKIVK